MLRELEVDRADLALTLALTLTLTLALTLSLSLSLALTLTLTLTRCRFMQTLRVYHDTHKRWPALGNALKYASSTRVV